MNIHGFFKGEERTVKAKKNVLASILIKGVDSLVYLLLVPVTLGYLNQYEYGIWLTLNSILMWINSFDIGLGNGMRNRLAEAMAKGDRQMGRIYVSTTFIMLIALMGLLITVGTVFEPFVDWYGILSTSPEQVPHLDEIVYMAFAIFCLNFIFKFIGNVYLAMQLPAVNNIMTASGHLLSLIIIYILTFTTPGSLFLVAVTYSVSPLLIYLIAYPITFKKIYPHLAPSIHCFRKEHLSPLLNISLKFFLIQLSAVVLFAFTNLLISHMFGPENVTPYNIAYRYFSLVPMVVNIIISPIWSATTEAYTKGDIGWITRIRNKITKVLWIATVVILLMILISESIYRIWIGSELHVPFILSVLMGLYIIIIIWSISYSSFLNGLGKLRLQTINTLTVAVLYLPVCYFLGSKLGINGILIGLCILNISGLYLNYAQFNKILTGKASGIWIE